MTPTEARIAAKNAGLRYFEGKVCKRGHSPCMRYVSDGNCVICTGERAAKWRRGNPEKAREIYRKYAANNPEKVFAALVKWRSKNRERLRAIDAAYRQRNPERVREIGKLSEEKYRKNHQEKIRVKGAARRAIERICDNSFTEIDIKFLWKFQKKKCAFCRTSIMRKYHIDHIRPVAKGGTNSKRNIQLLCAKCNLSKGAKDPLDFARWKGLLV